MERSVYDCLYIALAIRYDAEMITADERLANSSCSPASCEVARRVVNDGQLNPASRPW